MRVGSLFTGIGGFDLGLERAGLEIAWQCEIDLSCRYVLRKHWPAVHCYEDVRNLEPPAVDVLCGGFPCQDISVAGRRAGLDGSQSRLFHEFMRVAGAIAPTWILIENVPGLLSSNEGRDLATVLGTLGQLGYGWAFRVLDAQFFGVPQRRRRIFIVGCAGADQYRATQILFEPSSCDGDLGEIRSPGTRVATAVDGSPDGTVSTLQGGGHRGYRIDAEGAAGGHLLVASLAENQRGELVETPYAHSISIRGGKPGQGYPAVRDGKAVRRLMPMECERLQGFPRGWTSGLKDAPRYRMLGNAVAVPVAEWIGRRLTR